MRIGWLLVPDELVDSVDRLAGNLAIRPPSLSQLAAVAASEAYDELDANVARNGVNRAMVAGDAAADRSRQVGSRGWRVLHVCRRVRWTDSSLAFVARALAECGVAIAPGMDFDPVDGGRYVRMCFAGDATEIGQGITWLGAWLAPAAAAVGGRCRTPRVAPVREDAPGLHPQRDAPVR